MTWYAFKLSDTAYGIFDTFEPEDGRQAHLNGQIPAALAEVGPDLLGERPGHPDDRRPGGDVRTSRLNFVRRASGTLHPGRTPRGGRDDLVLRLQRFVSALIGSAAGRTALLSRGSAAPWQLPAEVALHEMRSFARAASLHEALEALVHGPLQAGAPARRGARKSGSGGGNDRRAGGQCDGPQEPRPGSRGDDRDCLGLGARLAACDRRLVMGDELAITVRRERGVVIAAVTGDIDISTVTRLRERLFGLADGGQTLIVDLNRVTFIDSAGLGALVGAARRAAAHGGSLHAVCARPQTRRLLWLTGVDRRIPLAATVDGALMFLAARDAPG